MYPIFHLRSSRSGCSIVVASRRQPSSRCTLRAATTRTQQIEQSCRITTDRTVPWRCGEVNLPTSTRGSNVGHAGFSGARGSPRCRAQGRLSGAGGLGSPAQGSAGWAISPAELATSGTGDANSSAWSHAFEGCTTSAPPRADSSGQSGVRPRAEDVAAAGLSLQFSAASRC